MLNAYPMHKMTLHWVDLCLAKFS